MAIRKEDIIHGAKEREVLAIFAFLVLACAAIFLDQAQGVPIYMLSLLIIAVFATIVKKDSIRVAALLAIVLLSGFSIGVNGVKFGIDFSGGVRLPVLLEQPVDTATMDQMVNTIQTRAAAFGLTEVDVTPIGDSEIYVELPAADCPEAPRKSWNRPSWSPCFGEPESRPRGSVSC